MEELDVNGDEACYYTWGSELISQERGGVTSYYLCDGHGSVRCLTDENGTVTDTYDYDAWGNLLASTGNTENSYRYCGEQMDATTGLYYLRARYMNPGTGTFISMDVYPASLFEPMSLHRYLYANANPVSNSDPSGYFTLTETLVAQGISGILDQMATLNYAAILHQIFISVAATGMELYLFSEMYEHIASIAIGDLTDDNIAVRISSGENVRVDGWDILEWLVDAGIIPDESILFAKGSNGKAAQSQASSAASSAAAPSPKKPNKKGEKYNGKRDESLDFAGKRGKGGSTLEQHASDHGYSSPEQYLQDARNFLDGELTDTTETFVTNEGTYFRYDTATNEFGIINRYGGISTYFHPDTGILYWLDQIVKFAPK